MNYYDLYITLREPHLTIFLLFYAILLFTMFNHATMKISAKYSEYFNFNSVGWILPKNLAEKT